MYAAVSQKVSIITRHNRLVTEQERRIWLMDKVIHYADADANEAELNQHKGHHDGNTGAKALAQSQDAATQQLDMLDASGSAPIHYAIAINHIFAM